MRISDDELEVVFAALRSHAEAVSGKMQRLSDEGKPGAVVYSMEYDKTMNLLNRVKERLVVR